ncbi:MAG TPA: hypothetical protein VFL79_17755 [Terriglobia bacterium]|nr:hypothetical protein [Terriglobia bacterium]
MKRITRYLLLAVAVALVVLHPAPAAATVSVLDQSQAAQNSLGDIGIAQGEVFTAGLSGYLDRVSLYLGLPASGAVTGQVNVQIELVTSDGLPSKTRIGYGSISPENISPSGGWVDVYLDGAFVTAGAQYALLLSTSDGIVSWYMEIGGDVKPYPSGYWVSRAMETAPWQKLEVNQDWTFQTHVAPDTRDQNQDLTSGTGGGTRALGSTPVGQTFTTGLYGYLDRVSVYLTNSSPTPAPITVSILKVGSNGLPVSGTQVATGTIPAQALPQPYARKWASAGLKPFLVKPDERYAILLWTAGDGVQWVLVSNVYSRGTQVIRNGTSWAATSDDFAFQTYVLEPILDQAQPQYSSVMFLGQYGPGAQTFTPHITGTLARVSVVLSNFWSVPATSPVSVNIATTVREPTWPRPATNIGSGTIPLSAIPPDGSPGWVDVNITGASVTAGTQYAIVLEETGGGTVFWHHATAEAGATYPDEWAMFYSNVPYSSGWYWSWNDDLAFKTYVLPVPTITTAPGPGGGAIMPCSNGVCPAASGGFNPADLTEGVKGLFQFQERPNGTVHGILNFSDPRPEGIALRGCTTESAACVLTVTTLACTDTQSMMVAGTVTPKGGASTNYQLTLSNASDGSGYFSLTAGGYTYSITLSGSITLACPPLAAPGGP